MGPSPTPPARTPPPAALPPLLNHFCTKPPGGDFQIANLFMLFFSKLKPCKSSWDKAQSLVPHTWPYSRHKCLPAGPSTRLAGPLASQLSPAVNHPHTLPEQPLGTLVV